LRELAVGGIAEKSLTAVLDGIAQSGVTVQAKEAHGKCDFACAVFNRTKWSIHCERFPGHRSSCCSTGQIAYFMCSKGMGFYLTMNMKTNDHVATFRHPSIFGQEDRY
jgi:hypothetical protein